jgi:SAM-dependent methyltransferase
VSNVALDRTIALLDEQPSRPPVRDGYVDLLGDAQPGSTGLSQQLMRSRGLPIIYERLWRPVGARLLMGGLGGIEQRETEKLLALGATDLVLDVGCGPGNVTRRLAEAIGRDGLAIGLDSSQTMLARAVQDTTAANVAYVRGIAERLPFRDASFDAVCCYATLYLVDDPFAAIDELARVLSPGGRVAVLTSCHRGPSALRPPVGLFTSLGGLRMFGSDEIVRAFLAAGLGDVRQRIARYAQFVGARKPSER